ncbi:hypothetical protein GCM10010425_72280 [Streptomyces spororaveus]|uniref:Uncharacterized protein n=1 Tax=Streptomyces spororaveus TaxID=284039 RepID=A0ABQ3T4A6_9ACTN|nr:hypothetical protein Sspor_07900 [Streptomyces spororaveus]
MGAGGGVLGQPDVTDAGEVGGVDAGAAGEGVVGADGEYPGQLHDGAQLDAADRGADGDPGEVEVVGGEGVEAAAAGVLGLELQAHLGVAAAEGDDGFGHEVPHRRRSRGDADGAAAAPDEVVEAAQGAVESGDALGGGRPEDAAGLGGYDATGVALQEAGAGPLLQSADVLADGRLGAAEIAGHGAEAAGAADGHEHTKIIEGHEIQGIAWMQRANRRIDLGFGWDQDRCRARAATRPRPRHGVRNPGTGRDGCRPTRPTGPTQPTRPTRPAAR